MPSNVLEHRLQHEGGAENHIRTSGLDSGQRACRGRASGQRSDELPQLGGPQYVALGARRSESTRALRSRCEIADGSAHPHDAVSLRVRPPGFRDFGAHRGPRPLELLARQRAGSRKEALADPHRAERPGAECGRLAIANGDELHAPATEVEHRAVGERGRVDRRQIAVFRFLLRREHADVEPGELPGAPAQVIAVGGIADGAGRDGVDRARIDATGAAVPREHVERLHATCDSGRAQLVGPGETLRDADRLLQLAQPPPGAALQVAICDEPPRVGPEVDHRGRLQTLGSTTGKHGQRRLLCRGGRPGTHGCSRLDRSHHG